MKQGLKLPMNIRIGMDIDLIQGMDFLFKQGDAKKEFHYPSTAAEKIEDRVIQLTWTPEDTYIFEAKKRVDLDTKITLKDSTFNPETKKTSFIMDDTLFERS